ncbi:hypothetical protein [Bradyrhizobium ganzhouense]|uniref:hypothetical protein n=1 Tax=Bradyrhizobium ganzhouense TaxID=1179767 RepID=UPI003CF0D2E0
MASKKPRRRAIDPKGQGSEGVHDVNIPFDKAQAVVLPSALMEQTTGPVKDY